MAIDAPSLFGLRDTLRAQIEELARQAQASEGALSRGVVAAETQAAEGQADFERLLGGLQTPGLTVPPQRGMLMALLPLLAGNVNTAITGDPSFRNVPQQFLMGEQQQREEAIRTNEQTAQQDFRTRQTALIDRQLARLQRLEDRAERLGQLKDAEQFATKQQQLMKAREALMEIEGTIGREEAATERTRLEQQGALERAQLAAFRSSVGDADGPKPLSAGDYNKFLTDAFDKFTKPNGEINNLPGLRSTVAFARSEEMDDSPQGMAKWFTALMGMRVKKAGIVGGGDQPLFDPQDAKARRIINAAADVIFSPEVVEEFMAQQKTPLALPEVPEDVLNRPAEEPISEGPTPNPRTTEEARAWLNHLLDLRKQGVSVKQSQINEARKLLTKLQRRIPTTPPTGRSTPAQ